MQADFPPEQYLLVAYLKFLHGFKMSLTKITRRIKETLMQNLSLLEMLCLERRALEKPPDWNRPAHQELFPSFMF